MYKKHYDNVIIGWAQKNDNPHESVMVITPDVKRLTDKRRLEIGRELFEFAGHDVELWDEVDEKEQLRFTRTHMGRYSEVDLTFKDGRFDYVTPTASGGGYPAANIFVLT